MMRVVLFVAGLSVGLFYVEEASACSRVFCTSSFVPSEDHETRSIPVNYPVVVLLTSEGDSTVRATRTQADASETIDLPVETDAHGIDIVRLPDPHEGESWTLEATTVCEGASTTTSTTIEIGPEATLPENFGQLSVGAATLGAIDVEVWTGECSRSIDAVSRSINLAFSDAAAPFANHIQTTLLIDGVETDVAPSIGGFSSAPGGTHVAFAGCEVLDDEDEPRGLEEGEHSFQLIAKLAGSDVTFTTETLNADFVCNTDPEEPAEDPASGSSGSGCSIDTHVPSAATTGVGGMIVLGAILVSSFRRARNRRLRVSS